MLPSQSQPASSSSDNGNRGILTPMVFQDVSKTSSIVTVPTDVGLAEGRLEITRLGLVLQGKCTNEACLFCNLMVNMCLGLGTFELAYEHARFRCPRCDSYTVPQTCLYTGCWWRVVGVMQKDPKDVPEIVETNWRCASSLRYDSYESLELATWFALRLIIRNEIDPTDLQDSFSTLDSFAHKRLVLESILAGTEAQQTAFMNNSRQACFLETASASTWAGVPAFEVFVKVIKRLADSSLGAHDFVQVCRKRAVLQTLTTRIGNIWDDLTWALPDIWEEDEMLLRSMARALVFQQRTDVNYKSVPCFGGCLRVFRRRPFKRQAGRAPAARPPLRSSRAS